MLIGGKILKEKMILVTESAHDANMIKLGLAGKNNFISIPPYGNQILPQLDTANLSLRKASKLPFSYEEVRTIVKKVEAFGKARPQTVANITNEARHVLEAQLTKFLPDITNAKLELAVSYNWISMQINGAHFQEIYDEVLEILNTNADRNLKIFSNNQETISIHNYDMRGIYIARAQMEKIIDAFKKNALFNIEYKQSLLVKCLAFITKCVVFMEARQQCQHSDEAFELEKNRQYNPMLGNRDFIERMQSALDTLSHGGDLLALDLEKLGELYAISKNEIQIDSFGLMQSIRMCYANFINDFKNEISMAYKEKQRQVSAA